MMRGECLAAAADCVLRDRNATHGEPESSFGKIAKGWSALKGVEITATDVALMLAWLKIVRAHDNPAHEDSFVDLAGYAACGAETAHALSENAKRSEAVHALR
jgi:hypothetical protein